MARNRRLRASSSSVLVSGSSSTSSCIRRAEGVSAQSRRCTLFAAWLIYAVYGEGVRWRSAKLFAGPVAALTAAMMLSTLLSIDIATSFNGVYERQFGLQGFLACVGLYFLTSTGFRGKRGAWLGLGVLAVVGSTIGISRCFRASAGIPGRFFGTARTPKCTRTSASQPLRAMRWP